MSKDLTTWRKKGIFIIVILYSFLPFFIIYKASLTDINLLQLRYFIGIAIIQTIAQILIFWYILKNEVPKYIIYSFLIMTIFFQLTYGISVILISHA